MKTRRILHGAFPFDDASDQELDASGHLDLPGKYRVMVAAPRAAFNQTLGLFAWNSFFSFAGCGPIDADRELYTRQTRLPGPGEYP